MMTVGIVAGAPLWSSGGATVITGSAVPADRSEAAQRTATMLALARALTEARARGFTRVVPMDGLSEGPSITVRLLAGREDDPLPGGLVLHTSEARAAPNPE